MNICAYAYSIHTPTHVLIYKNPQNRPQNYHKPKKFDQALFSSILDRNILKDPHKETQKE